MKKIMLKILIFKDSRAYKGPSNALGLLGHFLLL